MTPSIDHWKQHAQHWSHIRPPLRPSSQDINFTRRAIEDWLRSNRAIAPTVLVLGVTRELCSLPIKGNGRVIAVDRSPDMIRSLWAPHPRVNAEVICSDWREIPLKSASIDLALADGALSPLPFPSGYFDMCTEMQRLLRPGGQWIVRCFAQTENPETVDNVFADLSSGQIGNFHVLKWRLTMALQENSENGVPLSQVWQTLNDVWPDLGHLAALFGWPEAEVLTINAYQNVETRYFFPTLAQHLQLFSAAGFGVVNIATPEYELGERCPTLVLARDDETAK